MYPKNIFDQDCRICPRLDNFLCEVKQKYPAYHARPVAPFGDANANLLVVGLAPGMDGANASGRPFTGDYAGLLLYETLYQFGYSSKPVSLSLTDGLELRNCRITNTVKCLPPQNKPSTSEINNCNNYLAAEIKTLPNSAVILALGTIAHRAVLKALGLKFNRFIFSHNTQHDLPGERILVDSYHSSRYNMQTKRLTKAMFDEVFCRIDGLLKHKP